MLLIFITLIFKSIKHILAPKIFPVSNILRILFITFSTCNPLSQCLYQIDDKWFYIYASLFYYYRM